MDDVQFQKLLDCRAVLSEYCEKVDGHAHLRNACSNIEAYLRENPVTAALPSPTRAGSAEPNRD